jgi:uncharacterized protein
LRAYLDANVFLYAVGQESPYRDRCRTILAAVVEGRIRGETSAYTLQEIVRHRLRRRDRRATTHGRDVLEMCSEVHIVDSEVVSLALDLVDGRPRLDVADAVHVATATTHGLSVLISADRGLDGLDGIERIDPLDTERLEALIAG